MKARTPGAKRAMKTLLSPCRLKKRLAALDQLRILAEWPTPKDLPPVTMAEPKGDAIADDRTGNRRGEQRP